MGSVLIGAIALHGLSSFFRNGRSPKIYFGGSLDILSVVSIIDVEVITMTGEERGKTFREFREKFPAVEGLNISEMRGVLDGTLVMVRLGRSKTKFKIMTREQVAPGGELDKHNAEVRAYNRKIRAQRKVVKATAMSAMADMMNGKGTKSFEAMMDAMLGGMK
jgi:hypothetical protein